MNNNRYNPISRVSSGRNIEQCLRRGTGLQPNGQQLGTPSQRFGTLRSNVVECPDITVGSATFSSDGPYAVSGANVLNPSASELAKRLTYSTTGKVSAVNSTPVTFSTNTAGECGLFAVYNEAYTAVCVGQYSHTATPTVFISGGSPPLTVTISGSSLRVAFTSPTTATDLVWKKLKFNS